MTLDLAWHVWCRATGTLSLVAVLLAVLVGAAIGISKLTMPKSVGPHLNLWGLGKERAPKSNVVPFRRREQP